MTERYVVQYGTWSTAEFGSWPEALKCAVTNRSPEVFNPDEMDNAEDAGWRANHGLTETQYNDLLEAGLV